MLFCGGLVGSVGHTFSTDTKKPAMGAGAGMVFHAGGLAASRRSMELFAGQVAQFAAAVF